MQKKFLICLLMLSVILHAQETQPVNHVGKITIGMTLPEVQSAYPEAVIKQTPNPYASCADEKNSQGYQIRIGEKLLAFALLSSDGKINRMVVTSADIRFGKIHPGMTVRKILRLYPKTSLYSDLLSNYEAIYLPELNIKVVFNTNEENTVGLYNDETFVKLKRPDARVDYIEVY